jgi:anti-sigma regulatory factor (Ser/Thr protein kinase)
MSIQTLAPARSDDALIHAALLYRDPEHLRVTVTEFLADAVREREPVLALLPTANLELLADALGAGEGDVTVQDMTEVGRNPACLLGMLEEWMAAHPGRARVVSEPMWPQRSAAEAAECLRHEALLNDAFAKMPASFLCPYDAEHLAAEIIAGAEMTHPHLLDETGARPSGTYGDPLTLASGAAWPLHEPAGPVHEHPYDGDLRALRHDLAADPFVAELEATRREDLVFAVNEAVANAVRHGDGIATTRVWRDGDEIISEVNATSRFDDPYAGRRRPSADAPDGRGLWMINQLCDLVELRSDADGLHLRLHVGAVA